MISHQDSPFTKSGNYEPRIRQAALPQKLNKNVFIRASFALRDDCDFKHVVDISSASLLGSNKFTSSCCLFFTMI